MKVSELIVQLKVFYQKYGDLPVELYTREPGYDQNEEHYKSGCLSVDRAFKYDKARGEEVCRLRGE